MDELKELTSAKAVSKAIRQCYGAVYATLRQQVETFFKKQRGIGIHEIHRLYSGKYRLFRNPAERTRGYYFTERKIIDMTKIQDLKTVLTEAVLDRLPEVRQGIEEGVYQERTVRTLIWSRPALPEARKKIIRDFNDEFTQEKVRKLLMENRYFRRIMREIEEAEIIREKFQTAMIEQIPENPVELYPVARKMKRHFVLHIGPTNSGKTYDAMQAHHGQQPYSADVEPLFHAGRDRAGEQNDHASADHFGGCVA